MNPRLPSRLRVMHTACWLGLATACAALWSAGLPAQAQDVVTLRAAPGGGPPRTVSGQIVDYTGRELRIRLPAGRERSIPPADIERIETDRCAEQSAGDQLFADGDFRLAEAKYRAAIETDREVRPWVRRQILAQLVRCYENSGQWEQAGEIFLTLVARDPDTPYFDCIPLAWMAVRPSPALETKARAWLADVDNPVAGLLGASHLLSGAGRAAAVDRLRQLTRDDSPRIAWLAQTQLWRAQAAQATQDDLDRWSRYLEQGDEMLRAGPYYVLGSTLAAHDPQAAAIALLEVPILYAQHARLAAASLLEAGACLEKTGSTREAAGLYRELLDRYQGATETGEARRRLARLAGTSRD